METIPPRIETQLLCALDNLSLCECVCEFLGECAGTPIPTVVHMTGSKRTVVLPGENCGFVTTPIIHAAILDIRRLLPFLGIAYRQKEDDLKTMSSPKWPDDDCWVGDLGLNPIKPLELDAVAESICGSKALSILRGPILYSNKQMAHFSKTEGLPNFEDLRNASRIMIAAVMIFIYDALSIKRPQLHFSKDES